MLDLSKKLTVGLKERDASSSTPTARVDPKHEFFEEKSLDEKLLSVVTDVEILQQKIPRVRKVSSVPNQEEMCSLIIRKTTVVKSVRRQTQHEPGVE